MRISDWSSGVCSSDLPDRIGVFGAVPMHQLELVAEGGSTFMCQGQHRRIDPPHDIAHAAIGRHSPLPFADDGGETAMDGHDRWRRFEQRSEEHTSELQSLMRISYAVFCLKKKKKKKCTRVK